LDSKGTEKRSELDDSSEHSLESETMLKLPKNYNKMQETMKSTHSKRTNIRSIKSKKSKLSKLSRLSKKA
jgi:hypothetical protein